MLSYKKAFKLADEKNIKIYKIIVGGGLVVANMRRGQHITTRTINQLCTALQCQPGDLMEYIPDKSE